MKEEIIKIINVTNQLTNKIVNIKQKVNTLINQEEFESLNNKFDDLQKLFKDAENSDHLLLSHNQPGYYGVLNNYKIKLNQLKSNCSQTVYIQDNQIFKSYELIVPDYYFGIVSNNYYQFFNENTLPNIKNLNIKVISPNNVSSSIKLAKNYIAIDQSLNQSIEFPLQTTLEKSQYIMSNFTMNIIDPDNTDYNHQFKNYLSLQNMIINLTVGNDAVYQFENDLYINCQFNFNQPIISSNMSLTDIAIKKLENCIFNIKEWSECTADEHTIRIGNTAFYNSIVNVKEHQFVLELYHESYDTIYNLSGRYETPKQAQSNNIVYNIYTTNFVDLYITDFSPNTNTTINIYSKNYINEFYLCDLSDCVGYNTSIHLYYDEYESINCDWLQTPPEQYLIKVYLHEGATLKNIDTNYMILIE